MTATITEPAWINWIRPWYPGGAAGDHIDIECPELAKQTSTPTEGSGWLDPRIGPVCEECVECVEQEDGPSWDAVCDTCDASMSEEWDDDEGPVGEKDAKDWKSEHECEPSIRIISPADAQ